MADLDTVSKRASGLNFLHPATLQLPIPDATIDAGDRQHAAMQYSGILAGGFTPPVVGSGGGAFGGGDDVRVQTPDFWRVRDARTRRNGLGFQLGPVSTVVTATATVRTMHRVAATPTAPAVVQHPPLYHVMAPTNAVVHIRATVSRMEIEPLDDPDELFALGLV